MTKNKRKLYRKVKTSKYGRKPEIDYARDLLAISELCKAEGQSSWKMTQDTVFIGDSAFLGDAPAWLNKIADSFNSINDKIKGISGSIASKVVYGQADLTDKEIATHIKKATGIDIDGLVSPSKLNKATTDAINANVSLIESIPTEYKQKLERIMLTALQENRSQEYIAEKIKKLGDMTDARASMIARDQTGKLASTFSEIRLKALGFETYIWETKGDNRVRYVHAKRQGIRFRFDDPPYDGHAGQPIGCRCRKMPDLDGLMDSDSPSLLRRLMDASSGLFGRSKLN